MDEPDEDLDLVRPGHDRRYASLTASELPAGSPEVARVLDITENNAKVHFHLAAKRLREGEEPFRVVAPLLRLTKGEIIRLGLSLGVDYGKTSSCYDPGKDGRPCRECDSCLLRARGFREAGAADPLLG